MGELSKQSCRFDEKKKNKNKKKEKRILMKNGFSLFIKSKVVIIENPIITIVNIKFAISYPTTDTTI